MGSIWFVVIGAIIALVCLIVGVFIGLFLSGYDNDDYDDDDLDEEKSAEEIAKESKFIEECFKDEKLQKALMTYHNGIVKVEKEDISLNIIRLIDDYTFAYIDLDGFSNENIAYYRLDEDDYVKYSSKINEKSN